MDPQSNLMTSAEPPPTPKTEGLPFQASTPSTRSPKKCTMGATTAAINSSITPPPTSRCLQSRSKTPENENPVIFLRPVTTVNCLNQESTTMSLGPPLDLIQAATNEELREMLNKIWNENVKLQAIANEARMSAAHYKLHYNLLNIESQEALNRMEVENYMFQREVAIMRQNPLDPTHDEYNKRLREYCNCIKEDNIIFNRRLKKAKRLIEVQDGKLVRAQQVISLLQERIRQNRKHINEMRCLGGPLHNISSPIPHTETPQQHCSSTTRRNLTQNTSQSLQKNQQVSRENQERFNALLLAGSILNQESKNLESPTASCFRPPSTPQFQQRHLKSNCLSKSPGHSQNTNALLPPVQFTPEVDEFAQSRSKTRTQLRTRRRKSRDSTISASDFEELDSNGATNKELFGNKQLCAIGSQSHSKNFDYRDDRLSLSQKEKEISKSQEQLYRTRVYSAVAKRKREEELAVWERDQKKGKNNGERVELSIGC